MHRKFSTYDHELYIKIFEREDFSTTSYEDTLSFEDFDVEFVVVGWEFSVHFATPLR